NQPWLAKQLRGAQIVLSGKVDQYLGRLNMNSPEWESLEKENLHTNRIVPVYPLSKGLKQKAVRGIMHKITSYWAARVEDPLPEKLRQDAHLMPLAAALSQVHYPDAWEALEAARHRLAFDEIFLLQLGVMQQRRSWKKRTARVFETSLEWLNKQKENLPFTLTKAQNCAVDDVRTDLASGHPMNRLLQGDVGSGKTVVAGMAIAMVT
ncbi:MAG: DNA helicase RecG, partial [Gammaproteobacteria bacterium]|nr:DNA helicase RecG [Gammaproteobacteria bacterium]